MITTKEILRKADNLFFKIVAATFKNENIFPYSIPGNKQLSGTNYTDWKSDLVPLYEQSKAVKSKGYTIEWKEKIINGSKQSVPAKIYFETLEDFLQFTGRTKDYKRIFESQTMLLENFPKLLDWTHNNLPTLLSHHDLWPDIIKVCKYFLVTPPPHALFIRELPIEIHTKFIEQNSTLLRKLLDVLLPSEWINVNEKDFAGRYHLKKINIYTQIRILDDELKPHLGFDELALTLEDAAWLKWVPEKVFIIENQTCYLTFPKIKNSVAIFGEGFKSRISKHIPWLNQTELYCWFDLDAAGFAMLSMIRDHYPRANSFLMDRDTFNNYSQFSVENKTRKKALPHLLPDEQKLYELVQTSNKRLEQERIPVQYVQAHLP